ncbi:hypothetical protein Tco_1571266 [Tanacetum coccineum]
MMISLINRIDVIDVACEEFFKKVLGFSNIIRSRVVANSSPLTFEPIISDSFLSFTLFEESDFILEEMEDFLKDDSISPEIDHADQIQQEKKKPTAQGSIPYWNSSIIDDEEAKDNFFECVFTLLRKFRCLDGQANIDKRNQELMSKTPLKMQNSVKRPITPDLPIEEPDNSLSMGDEHLDTIPSIENLVPIPSEFEGIFDDTCDVPVRDDSSTFDALNDDSEILSNSNDDDTSSDNDDFEDVGYVRRDVHRLISNIESLKVNSTPDRVLKSPSPFPIPVADSDSFLEESDTSLSYLDNSLPEFETSSDHTEETRSGSTTTHANYSLPEYDSFLFEIEPDQEGLISIDNSNDPLLELPEFESFHFDPSFPRPPPEPPDVEICLHFEPDAPVIDNFNELNDDQRGSEIDFSQNVEDDDSFTFVIRTFLPFLTYPEVSPLSCSTGSEDTIFDPGIST